MSEQEELCYLNTKISFGIANPLEIKKRDELKESLRPPKLKPVFETIQTRKCRKV